MLSAKIIGREALERRLARIAPNVEKYAGAAKMKAGEDLAGAIRLRAPTGETLEYMESIEADEIANRRHQERVGKVLTRDKTAVGIFAKFIWRFLEFGTAPHNVAKGGGTAVGWAQHRAGGGIQHPGTQAQPHVFPTYRAMRRRIRNQIRSAVNKGIREAMGKK